jgi:hypothetical protein
MSALDRIGSTERERRRGDVGVDIVLVLFLMSRPHFANELPKA